MRCWIALYPALLDADTATTVKANTTVLHSEADETVPITHCVGRENTRIVRQHDAPPMASLPGAGETYRSGEVRAATLFRKWLG